MDNYFCLRFISNYLSRILKFGTKLDSDELSNKKTATYSISVLLFIHFSLSQMEISLQISQLLLAGWVVKWFLFGYTVRKNDGLLSKPMF